MLTEQQKNYLSMLLVGDALTTDEIRRFLARSGWSADQVEAGIVLSNEMKALPTSSSQVKESGTPLTQEPGVTIGKTDFENDSIKSFREATSKTSTVPMTRISSDVGYSTPTVNSQRPYMEGMGKIGIPLTQTMPEIPKSSDASKILILVAWILLIILILMIAGIIGYMYYMNIGIFTNLDLAKLF